jgi:hypothetical protein
MRKHGAPERSDVPNVNRGNFEGRREASGKSRPVDKTRSMAIPKVAVVTVLCWAAGSQDRHDMAHAEDVYRLHVDLFQLSANPQRRAWKWSRAFRYT